MSQQLEGAARPESSAVVATRAAAVEGERKARPRAYEVCTRALKPIALFAFIVLLWQYLVASSALPSYSIAAPSTVIRYIPSNIEKLLDNTGTTVSEMLIGYAVAVVAGVVLGILITQSRLVADTVMPLIIITQVVPSIAIAPILILIFGFGLLPKILIAAIVSFFPILINTVAGLSSLDQDTLDLSRSFGTSRLTHLYRFAIPTALPYMFAGFRIGITLSVIGAVVGEFVSPTSGLGYLVLQGSNQLDPAQVFSAIVILAFLGIVVFVLVRVVERLAIPWGQHVG